jgi:hypothetical protein
MNPPEDEPDPPMTEEEWFERAVEIAKALFSRRRRKKSNGNGEAPEDSFPE